MLLISSLGSHGQCSLPQPTFRVVLCGMLPGLSALEACHQSRARVFTGHPPSIAFQIVARYFTGFSLLETEYLCLAQWDALGTIQSKLIIMIVRFFSYLYVHFPSFNLITFLCTSGSSLFIKFFIPYYCNHWSWVIGSKYPSKVDSRMTKSSFGKALLSVLWKRSSFTLWETTSLFTRLHFCYHYIAISI